MARLIFIDETGASTKMARLSGRAPQGERCLAAVPHGHWKTTTFTAGLRSGGLAAPFGLDGPINGDAFRAHVELVLVPTLRPGDIVSLDNLGSHKSKTVRDAIRAAGAKRIFLPASSPDLNPPLATPRAFGWRSLWLAPPIDPSAGSGGVRHAETSHAKRRPREPSTRHGTGSDLRSTPARRKNAPIISGMQDMRHDEVVTL